MKSECCHQHPDNGSELALQSQTQKEETDLRIINAALLEALEALTKGVEKQAERAGKGEIIGLVGSLATLRKKAHAAIKAAKGD